MIALITSYFLLLFENRWERCLCLANKFSRDIKDIDAVNIDAKDLCVGYCWMIIICDRLPRLIVRIYFIHKNDRFLGVRWIILFCILVDKHASCAPNWPIIYHPDLIRIELLLFTNSHVAISERSLAPDGEFVLSQLRNHVSSEDNATGPRHRDVSDRFAGFQARARTLSGRKVNKT